MKGYGALYPTFSAATPADTVQTVLCVGSSNAQALDWPTSTGGAATNAAAAAAHMVRFTCQSTAGAKGLASINLYSTAAGVPSSGTSISSSGVNFFIDGTQTVQIPGNSTGWSAAALGVSVYVQAELWRK